MEPRRRSAPTYSQALAGAAGQRRQSYGFDAATPRELVDGATDNREPIEGHGMTTAASAVRFDDDSLWLDQPLSSLPLEPWRVQVKHIVRGLEGLDLAADPILREGDEICFVGSAADTLHAAQALNGEV